MQSMFKTFVLYRSFVTFAKSYVKLCLQPKRFFCTCRVVIADCSLCIENCHHMGKVKSVVVACPGAMKKPRTHHMKHHQSTVNL